MEEIPKNKEEKSTLMEVLAEITGSVVRTAQDRIVERVEEVANRITRNMVFLVIMVFLGLMGLVFILVGFAMWIGVATGLGLWFGFLLVGFIFSFLAVLVGLVQKIK